MPLTSLEDRFVGEYVNSSNFRIVGQAHSDSMPAYIAVSARRRERSRLDRRRSCVGPRLSRQASTLSWFLDLGFRAISTDTMAASRATGAVVGAAADA